MASRPHKPTIPDAHPQPPPAGAWDSKCVDGASYPGDEYGTGTRPYHTDPVELRSIHLPQCPPESELYGAPAGELEGGAPSGHSEPGPRAALLNYVSSMLSELVGTAVFLLFLLAAAQLSYDKAMEIRPPVDEQQVGVDYVEPFPSLQPGGLVYLSLASGLSLIFSLLVFHRRRGGWFNPAVTVGLVVTKRLSVQAAFGLVPSQLLGGLVASLLARHVFSMSLVGAETPLGIRTSTTQGLLIEAILTGLLLLAILRLDDDRRGCQNIAVFTIGLFMTLATMVATDLTGACLNPVRSFGPSLVARLFERHHWIYWVGPLMGATVVASTSRAYAILKLPSGCR